MKTCTTYRLNTPTTTSGHSITITKIIYGTEEEIAYLKKNCEETIGSGLVQEYASPLTSQFRSVPDVQFNTNGKVVPDTLQGWRYEE